MAGEFVQEILIRIRSDGTSEVARLGQAFDQLGQKAKSAGSGGAQGLGDLAGATGVVGKELDLLGANAAKSLGGMAQYATVALGPMVAVAGAVVGVALAMEKLVTLGIEEQKVERDLQAAVEISGASYRDYASSIEDTLGAVTAMSRFGSTEARSALETLVTLTGDVGKSEEIMAATANLAAARHMDLASASTLVARALEGSFVALRRQGIILDQGTTALLQHATAAERAAILQGLLNEKFGGRAQADVETMAGRIVKLKNEVLDLGSSLGGVILTMVGPSAEKAISWITDLVKKAEMVAAAQKLLATANQLSSNPPPAAKLTSVIPSEEQIGVHLVTPAEQTLAGIAERTFGPQIAKLKEELEVAFRPSLGDPLLEKLRALVDQAAQFRTKIEEAMKTAKEQGATPDILARYQAQAGNIGKLLYDAQTAAIAEAAKNVEKETVDFWTGLSTREEEFLRGVPSDVAGATATVFANLNTQVQNLIEGTGVITKAQLDALIKRAFDAAAQIKEISKSLEEATRTYMEFESETQHRVAMAVAGAPSTALGLTLQFDLGTLKAQAEQLFQEAILSGLTQRDALEAAKHFFEEGSKPIVNNVKMAAQEFERIGARLLDPLVEGLSDFFMTGGKDFGQIFGSAAAQYIKEGTATGILSLLGITKVTDQGSAFFGQYALSGGGHAATANLAVGQQMSKLDPKLQTGLVAGFAGVAAYLNKAQSDLEATLSGFQMGFGATGGLLGGLIVAAVAEIGHLFQSSKGADYQYGQLFGGGYIPGKGISLDWRSLQNIPTAQLSEISAAIATTVEKFWSGYGDIVLKYSPNLMPNLSKIGTVLQTTIGSVNRGFDIGEAASEHFMEHLQQFVEGTLPKRMAEIFAKPLESIFVSFGGTAEKFRAFWNEFQTLDPTKAMELVSDLFDALDRIAKDMKTFSTPVQNVGWEAAGNADLMRQYRGETAQSFSQSIAATDKQILDIASNLSKMTSQQQVAAAKEIASLMDERAAKEKAFLQNIISMMDSVNRSYQQQMESFKTKTMTPAEQYTYYQQQYPEAMAKLKAATTPEMAQQAWSDIQDILNKIVSAGEAAGVNVNDLYKAASDALTQAHDLMFSKLKQFADDVQAVNDAFTSDVQPLLDQLLTVVQGTTTGFDDLGDAAGDAAGGLKHFSSDLYSASEALSGFAASVRTSRASG